MKRQIKRNQFKLVIRVVSHRRKLWSLQNELRVPIYDRVLKEKDWAGPEIVSHKSFGLRSWAAPSGGGHLGWEEGARARIQYLSRAEARVQRGVPRALRWLGVAGGSHLGGTRGLGEGSRRLPDFPAPTPCPAGPTSGGRRKWGAAILHGRPERLELVLCWSVLKCAKCAALRGREAPGQGGSGAGRFRLAKGGASGSAVASRVAPRSAPQSEPRSFSRERVRGHKVGGRSPEAQPSDCPPSQTRDPLDPPRPALARCYLALLWISRNYSGSGLPHSLPYLLYFSENPSKQSVYYIPKVSPPSILPALFYYPEKNFHKAYGPYENELPWWVLTSN